MKKEQLDRRVQRTRQLLTQALMSLVVEKDYGSITVQNIIDRANLGRSTFYAHYQDKDDLLFSGMEEVVHRLTWDDESLKPKDGSGVSKQPFISSLAIFRHAEEEYDLHKAIVGGLGIDAIIKSIRDHLSEHIQEQIETHLPSEPPVGLPPKVMAVYLSGSLLTLLRWWLDEGMPYPPERMDEIFRQLALPGVLAVMNT